MATLCVNSNAYDLTPIEVKDKSLDELYTIKRYLYRNRDEIRQEIMKNGNETFQKYGSEFTHFHKTEIEKVETEIKDRINGTVYDNRQPRNAKRSEQA